MHLNPFNLYRAFRTFIVIGIRTIQKYLLIPLTVLNLLNVLDNGKVWRFTENRKLF